MGFLEVKKIVGTSELNLKYLDFCDSENIPQILRALEIILFLGLQKLSLKNTIFWLILFSLGTRGMWAFFTFISQIFENYCRSIIDSNSIIE